METEFKADRLQQKMEKSHNQTICSLAEKEGLTYRYIGKILYLNLLAHDIVEAILDGKQPKSLKLIDFLRKEIPMLWEEQEEKFEFYS